MDRPLIFSVQRYAIFDGPGIRTTVFFKGCPLRCAWCHNPESQSFAEEELFYPERCVHCGRCREGCPRDARQTVGASYEPEALLRLLLRDRAFYESSGGGVTFSGGEVMAQDEEYLLALLRPLQRQGVSVAIDTCGHAPYARFEAILSYISLFLYDIKAMDADLHRRYTGADNFLILENAHRLCRAGARLNARVPVIPGVNAEDGEMRAIARFVAEKMGGCPVSLLPYHALGAEKAHRLAGREAASFAPPSDQDMARIAKIFAAEGLAEVRIGG